MPFGVIALIVAAGVGYNLAKTYRLDSISGGILALVGFFANPADRRI